MTTLGGAEALRRGAGDSVKGVSDGRCQEPSAGPLLWAGGVTGVADRWRDNRCPGRRRKRWSHGRGREQHRRRGERRHYRRKIAGIAEGGEHRCCRMKFPALHQASDTGGVGPKIGFLLHIIAGVSNILNLKLPHWRRQVSIL